MGNVVNEAEKEGALLDAFFNNQVEEFGEIFTSKFNFDNPVEQEAYNKVFSQRNKTWSTKLEEIANKHHGTVFVAVGAGHLFGPGNLLDCLREKGYEIHQAGR